MGWESYDVIRFDLGPLFEGQARVGKLKNAKNLLLFEEFLFSFIYHFTGNLKKSILKLR